MSYTLIEYQPENPITENLLWNSDIMVGDNGQEQRVCLSAVPHRSLSGTFRFDTVADLRRYTNQMYSCYGKVFNLPYWHWSIKIKSALGLNASSIPVNAKRSQFRVGELGIISENGSYELFTVASVAAGAVGLQAPLSRTYSPRAVIAPVRAVFTENSVGLSRTHIGGRATASFNYVEAFPSVPYIDPLNAETLDTYSGLPVLTKLPAGTSFEETLDTGIEVSEYGGVASIRNRWKSYQLQMPRSYQVNRVLEPDAWDWWQVFLDYCKGPTKPFYVPTHVEDFQIWELAQTGGQTNIVRVLTDDYSTIYKDIQSRKSIVFTREDGVTHYATINTATAFGGRDTLIFSPPLPAGEWGSAKLSFLLKCRLSEDNVVCNHDNMQTTISVVLRTVPDDLSPE